ncbi:MAG: hypothetical protein IPG66_05940 [Hydrogenophilales bacterium]|nr:hypothetical protein [Hydrogenophilales bacterium]
MPYPVYPDLPTARGSDPEIASGLELFEAEDGSVMGASLWGHDRAKKIPIHHPGLTEAQRDTLEAFYAANKWVEIEYVSPTDLVSRICLFVQPPRFKRLAGTRWDYDVELREV